MWHNSPEDFIKDWYGGKFYYYKQKTINKKTHRQRRLFD